MKTVKLILLLMLTDMVVAQDGSILPGQKKAIMTMAQSRGYSTEQWNSYLIQEYGKGMDDLSRNEGAEIIMAFQSETIEIRSMPVKKVGLETASLLEPGMKKLFHFQDGTIRNGEILSIEDDLVALRTTSGTFKIPSDQFLSETADITNKRGELFKGIVLGETIEEFIIRTSYGDAIIQKRDIRTMKRYHGGVLDKKSEDRRKFYQGEAQLLNIFMDPTAFPLIGNTFYLMVYRWVMDLQIVSCSPRSLDQILVVILIFILALDFTIESQRKKRLQPPGDLEYTDLLI